MRNTGATCAIIVSDTGVHSRMRNTGVTCATIVSDTGIHSRMRNTGATCTIIVSGSSTLADDKSTLVQLMAWAVRHQAIS